MNYRNEAEFNHMWGETRPMEWTEPPSPTATGRRRVKAASTFPWFTATLLCVSIGTAAAFAVRALFA